jgi:hypothetical protein
MAVLMMLIGMPGCIRWKPVPVPDPAAPPNIVSNVSRVRLKTGQSVSFLTLVVAPDSLFGVRNNLGRNRVSISWDQVQRVEVREKDFVRTAGVFAIILGGLYWSGALGIGPNQ